MDVSRVYLKYPVSLHQGNITGLPHIRPHTARMIIHGRTIICLIDMILGFPSICSAAYLLSLFDLPFGDWGVTAICGLVINHTYPY